ncbi:hypothetical protein [Planococcus halotolerans]|uniref:hypothetical protein n=1 Tax=Planococcus halotolerans TaxID=2233542 RepID=UPI00140350C4|nr:hypothetical protein [Planococcus halotolerans]
MEKVMLKERISLSISTLIAKSHPKTKDQQKNGCFSQAKSEKPIQNKSPGR